LDSFQPLRRVFGPNLSSLMTFRIDTSGDYVGKRVFFSLIQIFANRTEWAFFRSPSSSGHSRNVHRGREKSMSFQPAFPRGRNRFRSSFGLKVRIVGSWSALDRSSLLPGTNVFRILFYFRWRVGADYGAPNF